MCLTYLIIINYFLGSNWFFFYILFFCTLCARMICTFFSWFYIFTDSALWAGSVIDPPYPSVCVSVPSWNTHFWRSKKVLIEVRIANFWPVVTQFFSFYSFNQTTAGLTWRAALHCTALTLTGDMVIGYMWFPPPVRLYIGMSPFEATFEDPIPPYPPKVDNWQFFF